MKYTITLDDNDLVVIDAGLQELVFKYANPVIQKINEQIDAQLASTKDCPKQE